MIPEVQYAKSADGVHLAYQVVGDGPPDLLFVPGFWSNLTWNWQLPSYAHFLRRLGSFCRLIVVDRRGSGLSGRLSLDDLPPLETLVDDLRVVLDEVGSERASLFGVWSGGQPCSVLAATLPERVDRLILYAMNPGGSSFWDEVGWHPETYLARVAEGWGKRSFAHGDPAWGLSIIAPSVADDPGTFDWFVASLQLAADPGAATALTRIYTETDINPILPSIRVPTLLLCRRGDRLEPVATSKHLADLIPGARLLELPGEDDLWFVGDDTIVDAIEEFVTGIRPAFPSDRVLATVLFTDVVGSTALAVRVGDAAWKELMADHDTRAKAEIERHRGTYVESTGDGLLATFDGPARAVRCAQAIGEAVRPLGMEIRSGCHTGEIELGRDNVRGIAVHIGARVAAAASAGEVLVSSTVKDLVAGSGLVFDDRGIHELKGVPGEWHLYSASAYRPPGGPGANRDPRTSDQRTHPPRA